MKHTLITVYMAASFAALPAPVFAQDASKVLGGLLQNLLKPPQASNNSAPVAATSTNDLVGLLSQSMEQIDEPKEIEMGRQLAAVLLGAKPLHKDLALQRYVNRLGRWISLQSERPNLPWTFAVLGDAGYNAFAAPGGYVFVTKGLVDSVADESELAGILAHEIHHVVAKHHLAALRKSAQTGLLTRVLATQLSSNAQGAMSEQLLALGREVYSKGLDQGDEFDADRNGVALAARAGFDPYGLVAVLQQLRTARPDNPVFTLALSTHPATQVRLDQLEAAMGQRLDALSGKASPSVPQRLARAGNR
jgi:predicted Zn-dependent protease